jgi:hypothetical protein
LKFFKFVFDGELLREVVDGSAELGGDPPEAGGILEIELALRKSSVSTLAVVSPVSVAEFSNLSDFSAFSGFTAAAAAL